MDENIKKIPLKQYAKNAYKYRYLMQEIVRKNVKLQYRNSFLGIFWTMLQPFLTMLVLVFIFTKVFGKATVLFVIPFIFLRDVFCMSSILNQPTEQ